MERFLLELVWENNHPEETVKKQTGRAIKAGQVVRAVGVAIAGATIGYVAGTLAAPASGRETRRRIGQRVEDEAQGVARKARRSLVTVKDGAQSFALKARTSLATARAKVADKVRG